MSQPAEPYLATSLIFKTRTSAHVGFSFYPRGAANDGDSGYGLFSQTHGAGGGLRDPANHSRISFLYYLKREGAGFAEVAPAVQVSMKKSRLSHVNDQKSPISPEGDLLMASACLAAARWHCNFQQRLHDCAAFGLPRRVSD